MDGRTFVKRFRFATIAGAVVFGGLVFLVGYRHFLSESAAPGKPPARRLRFASDSSLGALFVRDWGADAIWQDLAPACGKVDVPAGKEALLQVKLRGAAAAPPKWSRFFLALGFVKPRARSNQVDLSSLAAFRPNDLQELNAAGKEITDSQLANIAGLTGLQELCLSLNPVTDAGMIHLKGLTALKTLNLGGTWITDDGLRSLRDMHDLQVLDLAGTRITNAAADHLVHLRSLRRLRMEGTGIGQESLEKLRQALPDCRISH